METQYYTPSQLPSVLPLVNGKRVARNTIWRWMKAGKIEWKRIGGHRVISAEAIKAFLEGSEGNGVDSEILLRSAAARRILKKHGMWP